MGDAMAKRWTTAGCLTILVLIAGFVGYVAWELRGIDPPPLVGTALTHSERGESFGALLQKRFPIGSPAEKLEAKLTAQGFTRDNPEKITTCTPEGASVPPNKPYMTCPFWDAHWDPHNRLEVKWRASFEVACAHIATVSWSKDSRGNITHLEGVIENPCL